MAYITIADKVMETIIDVSGLSEHIYDPSESFEYLGVHELEIVDISLKLEEFYGIEMDETDPIRWDTPQDLAQYIVQKLGN